MKHNIECDEGNWKTLKLMKCGSRRYNMNTCGEHWWETIQYDRINMECGMMLKHDQNW